MFSFTLRAYHCLLQQPVSREAQVLGKVRAGMVPLQFDDCGRQGVHRIVANSRTGQWEGTKTAIIIVFFGSDASIVCETTLLKLYTP